MNYRIVDESKCFTFEHAFNINKPTNKMKTRIFTLACIIGLSNVFCYQVWAQHKKHDYATPSTGYGKSEFYISLLGQLAIPQNKLRAYSNIKGGLSLEMGKSFKRIPSFSAGLEVSGVITSPKKDKFKGLDISTNTGLAQFLPFIRWAPKKDLNVKPFLDFSTGITLAWTETTSVIVDEATFWEEVLLGAEDEVETTTHMDVTSTNLSYGIGAGVVIKKFLMVGIRYYHSKPMDYVNNETVYVKDNTILYNTQRIPIDMLVVTVGISNWGSHK